MTNLGDAADQTPEHEYTIDLTLSAMVSVTIASDEPPTEAVLRAVAEHVADKAEVRVWPEDEPFELELFQEDAGDAIVTLRLVDSGIADSTGLEPVPYEP